MIFSRPWSTDWTLQAIRKLVSLLTNWYILADISSIFRGHELVNGFLSWLFFFWVIETVYSLISAFIITRPSFVLSSMTSPAVSHPRLNDVCPICLDVMSETTLCTCTPCDHVFHHTCLSSWLYVSLKCPICRRSFTWSCAPDVRMTSHSRV